ncbi:MAG: ppiB [Gammaproteobacteria bacterium]|jgi:peptidyl-prolyl cis-trans isomerase B (cyclophilin B)|nr:ppiB [Gammaproteobacteria bacterium]
MLKLHTNHGDIVIELDFENTPDTAKNFLKHAADGYYNNTIFHRVIDGFMVQGGGFNTDMREKTKQPTIQNEAGKGKSNKRGTIAMARTPDPHSASTQFFINVKDNDFLNFKNETVNGFGYCVFGEVVEGMDVIDKIKVVKTTSRAGHQDVPVENVVIEKVTIIEAES